MIVAECYPRIVNIMKVHIERNNSQLEVELIRYSKFFYFVHVYFCEATDSIKEGYQKDQSYPPSGNVFGGILRTFGGCVLDGV